MEKLQRKGLSLIVLVITIIVILILSGAVILSLSQNSPISQANEATFKSDIDAVKSDYSMYIASQYAANKTYNQKKLNANELLAEYNGVNLPGKTIKDVIPVLATTDKYNGQFEVVNGVLIYLGTDRTKKRWAEDLSVEVVDADRLDAVITSTATLPVSAGTDVVITIKYSSNASIDTINLENKLELLDENNIAVSIQPVFEIATPTGTTADTLRTVDVTIKTDTLAEGSYKLKLKPSSVYNIYDVTITKEIVTNVLFEIDNTPPANPTIAISPTGWTNGDVTISITYPTDSTISEYSLDGTSWSTYTTPIVITENNATVYARATDISGNQSGQSTITIANIDKQLPTVTYAPNGGDNLQTISTKVTVTDVGVSNINNSSLEYVWDIQNSNEPTTGWNTFTNGNTIERAGDNTYYLWIKASDNAGNIVVAKSNSFVGDITPPENPTMSATPTGWTNGNVTVTITYSVDSNIKEYSTDGTAWSTYTVPVVVSTNNTTVYARATDASGNQSGQSTLTVGNIDKTSPSVPVANFNGYTPGTWTSSDITLNLSSTDVGSGIGKYQWSTDGTNWNDFFSSWLYNYDTVQTTCFRAVDNIGNASAATPYYNIFRDATSPANPTMSASPTGWTNGNVTVTITYSADSNVKEYSTNSTTWNAYTAPVVVSTNNTTVYARGKDLSQNQSGQSTLTVTNIDKTAPTAPNVNLNGYTSGTWTSSDVKIDLTSTDVGSGIQKYQYSHDGYNWSDIASSYTVNSDCNYYITYRAIDNVGNISASAVTNIIRVDKVAPTNPTMSANPTGWTNGNVTVTITYPGDALVKEYSTNGTTWTAYTAPVVVSTNNTTVYARGKDESGNQSGQSTLTVANIDKTVPTTPNVNLNGYTSGTWTAGDVKIDLSSTDTGSGINRYQYSYDGYTWSDISSSYTINYNYYYYITYRAIDNAGNASAAAATNIIQVDKSGPSYSSAEVKNISSTGYDVYVYGVSDSGSGMNRIQFPTWTGYNGQDDMATGWWSNAAVSGQNLGNGTWYFRVNRSDHNNEFGIYLTHIYLYDNVGNYTTKTFDSINVVDPNVVATFNLTAAQEVFTGSTGYSKPGDVSNNYTIEFDAQPSDTIDVFPENNTLVTHTGGRHRFVILESHGGGIPNAGLGVDLGTNGIALIAHSNGYYHTLLTYYTNLNAWNHYKIVVENRVPRLYINGTLIKTGYPPLSSYTKLYTLFSIGTGSYGSYIGKANNFVFYNTVR